MFPNNKQQGCFLFIQKILLYQQKSTISKLCCCRDGSPPLIWPPSCVRQYADFTITLTTGHAIDTIDLLMECHFLVLWGQFITKPDHKLHPKCTLIPGRRWLHTLCGVLVAKEWEMTKYWTLRPKIWVSNSISDRTQLMLKLTDCWDTEITHFHFTDTDHRNHSLIN